MKRKLFTLALIFLASGLSILFLFRLTRSNPDQGDFSRNLKPNFLSRVWEFDLGYNSYYIAGVSDERIYLANAVIPTRMVVMRKARADTQQVNLRLDSSIHSMSRRNRVMVRPPFFYVMDGKIPFIARGKLGDWRAKRFMYDSSVFFDAVPMGNSSATLRTISAANRQNILVKEMNTGPHIEIHPELLQKQVDGIFCTEGMLHYSPKLSAIIYVYRYRNQVLYMDTSLTLQAVFTTIDSISHARVAVERIKSEDKLVISGTPAVVNSRSRIDGHWLYVQSEILARNESPDILTGNCIIDVYHLGSKSYRYSFYLPKFMGMKPSDYYISSRKLIAIYGQHIVLYDLRSPHQGD